MSTAPELDLNAAFANLCRAGTGSVGTYAAAGKRRLAGLQAEPTTLVSNFMLARSTSLSIGSRPFCFKYYSNGVGLIKLKLQQKMKTKGPFE